MNDELRIKIAAILQSRAFENRPYTNVEIGYITALDIADALIAAGIGDVKEAELRAEVAESELERYTALIKPLEHRAEVAERALDLCETAYILSLNHRATEGISGQAIASDLGVHKFFMEQAKKELAGEVKR